MRADSRVGRRRTTDVGRWSLCDEDVWSSWYRSRGGVDEGWLTPSQRDGVGTTPAVDGDGEGAAGEDAVRTIVDVPQRSAMGVATDEDVRTGLQVLGDEDVAGSRTWRGRPKFGHGRTETGDEGGGIGGQLSLRGRQELAGKTETRPVDQVGSRTPDVFFKGRPDAEEDDRELDRPGGGVVVRPEGRLELTVEALHHPVGLGVVGTGPDPGGTEKAGQLSPQAGLEL